MHDPKWPRDTTQGQHRVSQRGPDALRHAWDLATLLAGGRAKQDVLSIWSRTKRTVVVHLFCTSSSLMLPDVLGKGLDFLEELFSLLDSPFRKRNLSVIVGRTNGFVMQVRPRVWKMACREAAGTGQWPCGAAIAPSCWRIVASVADLVRIRNIASPIPVFWLFLLNLPFNQQEPTAN